MRRSLNRARMWATVGMICGPDLVHDDVGVPLEQRHDRGELGELLALLGGGEQVGDAGAALPEQPRAAARLSRASDLLQPLGVGHQVDGQGAGPLDHVVAQPRARR